MKKLLITGGSGLLGSNLSKLAVSRFDVHATYNKNRVNHDRVNFFQIGLTDKEDFIKIEKINPDYIIHCAALVNVDYCEGHEKETYNQNVISSINVAEVAKKLGSYLIYISTDSVFNGEKGDYKENDETIPINVYGRTKLEAEKKTLSICPRSCVVRTNFYGWNKIGKFSLAEWMLDRLTNNKELPGLEDVYFSPIMVNALARALIRLCEVEYKGILHISGSESCSKLDFAYKIAEIFSLDSSLIKPISIRNLELVAPRGKNTSLNVSKAEKILKQKLPGVAEGLREMKTLQEEGYIKELRNE